MEDMARLALVEQNVRDTDKFTKLLFEFLRLINHILENPHDYELRTIKSDLLKKYLDNEAFGDYLKYVGFESVDNEMTYPKEQTLSKLRMAQAALERKIGFCCGNIGLPLGSSRPSQSKLQANKPKLTPSYVLNTKNPFLLKIEDIFNIMLRYEDEELQQAAREQIPLVQLQLLALDRVREHQRQIKDGSIKAHDLPFDIALLIELLGWFKHQFFRWVDKPACERCGGATRLVGNSVLRAPTETCKVELYQCTQCPNGRSEFPRYNDPQTLLRTRRGRCGEWANCFTLLCRALGYDTRYVYSTTDHDWCEVYDYDTAAWLHVDPCEAKLDAPLLYSTGWGKELSYVIAVSRDDLQDVTWRYTVDHKQILQRRNLCSERELIDSILQLRERRQRQVSDARRRYLAKRTLAELAQLMVERKAGESECHGRLSGSSAWVSARGEAGAAGAGAGAGAAGGARHEFRFGAGAARVRYCCASDEYHVSPAAAQQAPLRTWAAGAYEAKHVFRKVENDWDKVYIAREEGADEGSISWRLVSEPGCEFTSLSVVATHAVFESGRIGWTVRFDDQDAVPADIGETATHFTRQFRSVEVCARLSGGSGPQAWQHAQLFRSPRAAPASASAPAPASASAPASAPAPPALELRARVAPAPR